MFHRIADVYVLFQFLSWILARCCYNPKEKGENKENVQITMSETSKNANGIIFFGSIFLDDAVIHRKYLVEFCE